MDNATWFICGIFSGFIILMALVCLTNRTAEDHYKRGHIDALIGAISYEKITHENQTITWEKIKEKGEE